MVKTKPVAAAVAVLLVLDRRSEEPLLSLSGTQLKSITISTSLFTLMAKQ